MNQSYITTFTRPIWLKVVALLALLVVGTVSHAQEGSQGNTTVFGGAQMTFFGNHTFVSGGSGTQNGIIKTIRTAPFGIVNYFTTATQTAATNASHIDGYVGKYGTTAFTFPVGNGTKLRPVSISAPASGDFKAAYWFSNPNAATLPAGAPFLVANRGAGVSAVSNIEYWDVDGPSAINLTLSWDAASGLTTLTGGVIANLVVVGYNPTSSKWENLGRAGGTTGALATTGTITANGVTPNTYRAFTFAATCDLSAVSIATTTPNICVGGTTTFTATPTGTGPFTYQWQAQAASSTNWTNIPTGTTTTGNGVYSGGGTSTLTIAPTNAVWNTDKFRVNVTSTSGVCTVVSNVVAIGVVALPAVTITSAATRSICVGSTATFSATASGTGPFTYQWQFSDNGTTWDNLTTTNTTNASGSYSGAGTATLSMTPTNTVWNASRYRVIVGNGVTNCTVISGVSTMQVTPMPTVAVSAAQNICVGGTATFTATPTGTGPFTYQWQLSTNSGTSWANMATTTTTNANGTSSGAGTATLSISPLNTTLNGYRYRAIITTSGAGCSVTSNGVTLGVVTAPTVAVSAAQNICVGGTATFTATPTGTGPFTYQWQFSDNGGTSWTNLTLPGGGNANGNTSGSGTATVSIQPLTTVMNGYRYRAVITASGSGCSVTSNPVALGVVAAPTVAVSAAQNICVGGTATFTATPTGTGPFTYQWQLSTNSGTSWANMATTTTTNANGTSSGAGTATLSISPLNTTLNGYRYRAIITTSGAGCSVTSNGVTLGVVAAPTVAVSAAQNICVGGTATFTATPTGTGPFTYQWQFSTNGTTWDNLTTTNTTNASGSYSGAGTATLSMTPINTVWNASRYRVIVGNGVTNCTVISGVSTMGVVAPPAVSISTAATRSICVGSTAAFTAVASGTGPFTYQWQFSANGTTWENLTTTTTTNSSGSYSGAGTATLSMTPANTVWNASRYRVIVGNGITNCTVISGVSTMGVTAMPTVAVSAAQNICVGGTATFTATPTGTGPFTYQWQLSTNNGTSWADLAIGGGGNANGSSSGAGTATLSISPLTTIMNGYRYRAIITTNGGCTVTSNNATLGVVAAPTIASQPLPQNIYVGDTATFSVTASGTGPFTYLWQSSGDNGTSWNNLSSTTTTTANGTYSGAGTASLSLIPASTSWNTNRYRVIVGNGATNCTVISNGATLQAVVLPDLTLTLDIDALNFPIANTSRDFVINLYEINGVAATNPIVFRINKLSAFTITYPLTSGNSNVFGGTPHENSNWVITENNSFITITAKTGVVIPANGQAVVGFKIMRKPSISSGTTQNIGATISGGSAGEVNIRNNSLSTSVSATVN